MKSFLKRIRMYYLLKFVYRIRSYGKQFYMGRGNLINCKELSVGDFVYIGNNCHLSVDSLKIRDYTMLASQVSIVGGDHRFDIAGVPTRNTGRAERKGVIINKDCWLGHGVTVLDGVEIGEGAIIATGAIVTRSVEPYTIYAGVPAKKLRDRFKTSAEVKMHSKAINGKYQ